MGNRASYAYQCFFDGKYMKIMLAMTNYAKENYATRLSLFLLSFFASPLGLSHSPKHKNANRKLT